MTAGEGRDSLRPAEHSDQKAGIVVRRRPEALTLVEWNEVMATFAMMETSYSSSDPCPSQDRAHSA